MLSPDWGTSATLIYESAAGNGPTATPLCSVSKFACAQTVNMSIHGLVTLPAFISSIQVSLYVTASKKKHALN